MLESDKLIVGRKYFIVQKLNLCPFGLNDSHCVDILSIKLVLDCLIIFFCNLRFPTLIAKVELLFSVLGNFAKT